LKYLDKASRSLGRLCG